MIDLKICGITNYKDALHAKTAGASAIGMIFYSKSPRFIDIENAKKILLYSSMPSTSRHHWGTDIDINSLEPSYFEYGRGKIEYDWLVKNGAKFGFCQTYSDFAKNDRSSGYQEESWHWTYMPKSKKNSVNSVSILLDFILGQSKKTNN